MGSAFNQYQGANDTAMGMGNNTSFGGQDFNLNTQFYNQKYNSTEWKSKIKNGLTGLASAKISDLNSFNSKTNPSPSGNMELYNQNASSKNQRNIDLYNQLLDQEKMFTGQSQFKRYREAI
jgi:hypothetical protein